MSQQPKILVGCPTCNLYEYCLDDYLEGIKKLTYSNFDLIIVDNSEEEYKKLKEKNIKVIKDKYVEPAVKRIVNSRNILRKYALENNYDYFLSLEQDVVPPEDIIQRLLSHNKKAITGVIICLLASLIKPLLRTAAHLSGFEYIKGTFTSSPCSITVGLMTSLK